jgi:hypothetical protein
MHSTECPSLLVNLTDSEDALVMTAWNVLEYSYPSGDLVHV